jgi:hypothetical protein
VRLRCIPDSTDILNGTASGKPAVHGLFPCQGYGSRGIVLMTILQSWSQGVEVWGRDGMRKLCSAANIKVYGGGVAEAEFLNDLAQLVGSTATPT